MKMDQHKLRDLLACECRVASADELRREENVFFVGGNLPERETLETLFDSHFQSHAALFHLTFGALETFQNGEVLARMIKKNFNAHLVARLDYPVPAHLVERAYAAGVDILDIPVGSGAAVQERLPVIESARSVFPRWSVVSTLTAGAEPASCTKAAIDALLALDVVPLVTLAGADGKVSPAEVLEIFSHLKNGWRGKKVLIKPLLPLIYLSTPLAPASSKGALRGFIDLIDDRRLLATSDLRRILRVKEVEESYASSGL